jgi:small GTP-binding protein
MRYARLTSDAPAALAAFAVFGPEDALQRLDRAVSRGAGEGPALAPGRVRHGRLRAPGGAEADEVVLLAPEAGLRLLTGHGGPAAVRAVARALRALGAEPEPGPEAGPEPVSAPFPAGSPFPVLPASPPALWGAAPGSVRAEIVRRLPAARTAAQAALLLAAGAEGGAAVEALLRRAERLFSASSASSAAGSDGPGPGTEWGSGKELRKGEGAGKEEGEKEMEGREDGRRRERAALLAETERLLAGAERAAGCLRTRSLLLLGAPNAGKSSLFNHLLRRARVAVHAEPGTTRDPVSEEIDLAGFAVRLTDTAGLSAAAAGLDAAAEARVPPLLAEADAVAVLVDGSRPPDAADRRVLKLLPPQTPAFLLRTKADRPPAWDGAEAGRLAPGLPVQSVSVRGEEAGVAAGTVARLAAAAFGGAWDGTAPVATETERRRLLELRRRLLADESAG